MKNVFSIIFLCSLFLLPGFVIAQTITDGKSLVLHCQITLSAIEKGLEQLSADKQNDAFICLTYLSGIIGTARYSNDLAKLRYALVEKGSSSLKEFNVYCINWEIQYQQVARLVIDFAQRNPDRLNNPAHELVLRALQSAYPCH